MSDAAALLTDADLIGHLGLTASELAAEDTAAISRAVAAAQQFVLRYHDAPATDQAWNPDLKLGALMQAAGLYRRRLTPGGIETFGEGGALYTRRAVDDEVQRLLRIGPYAIPAVR